MKSSDSTYYPNSSIYLFHKQPKRLLSETATSFDFLFLISDALEIKLSNSTPARCPSCVNFFSCHDGGRKIR